MASDDFDARLTEQEAVSWDCIKAVIDNFLGKHRSEHYELFVDNMLEAMSTMGVHMSLKIHFMRSHLDYFARQLATESDEQGERFHQDILVMEKRYKGKRLDHMLADYCWATVESDFSSDDD